MPRWLAVVVLALAFSAMVSGGCGPGRPAPGPEVFVCSEDSGVLLIDLDKVRVDPSARLWSWKVADSPEIPIGHRHYFSGHNECKPVMNGQYVMVSSSWDGGVAIIRRADKKCVFYALGKGAHSLELIEGRFVATALSQEKGQIRLYDLGSDFPARPVLNAQPVWAIDSPWAHGVVWDYKRKVLYALGLDEVIRIRVNLAPAAPGTPATNPAIAEVLSRSKAPDIGGHDLFPFDESHLSVTFHKGAWLYDVRTEQFSPLPGLNDRPDLKSVGRHPVTAQVMYTQARPGASSGREIKFLEAPDVPLPFKYLYKARWNLPNRFSYGP